jgi:ribosomal-protein-alanine N-acetyltransferase
MVVDEMHVMNVATHPRWRRLGVARTLMERALAEARGLGIVRAFLEVRASNAAAQGLYNSLGFEPVGVRRSYYEAGGEDALVMAKALRAGHETP